MQSTWMPAEPARRRPTWPATIGWFVVGAAEAVAGCALVVALGANLSWPLAWSVAYAIVFAAIVAVVKVADRFAGRYAVALSAGIVTPFVLVAALYAYIAWVLSHSNVSS